MCTCNRFFLINRLCQIFDSIRPFLFPLKAHIHCFYYTRENCEYESHPKVFWIYWTGIQIPLLKRKWNLIKSNETLQIFIVIPFRSPYQFSSNIHFYVNFSWDYNVFNHIHKRKKCEHHFRLQDCYRYP